ncbi:MAG: hypothetical protein JXB88_03810 [Spirochaetales bacterium]|nr:hypothetical protein [Spirochaetales bacterium]
MSLAMIFLFFFHPCEPALDMIDMNAFTGQSIHKTTVLELSSTQLKHNYYIRFLDDFDKDPKNPEDEWIGMDKFWHWAMAFTLTGSSYHLVHNQINIDDPLALTISLSGTLFFSILKEFCDLYSYNLFSYKDLCYDILGMATGYAVFIWDWGR